MSKTTATLSILITALFITLLIVFAYWTGIPDMFTKCYGFNKPYAQQSSGCAAPAASYAPPAASSGYLAAEMTVPINGTNVTCPRGMPAVYKYGQWYLDTGDGKSVGVGSTLSVPLSPTPVGP